jgi:hypothetical protein
MDRSKEIRRTWNCQVLGAATAVISAPLAVLNWNSHLWWALVPVNVLCTLGGLWMTVAWQRLRQRWRQVEVEEELYERLRRRGGNL